MGQGNYAQINPMLEDWQQHPQDVQIFVNNKTGEQVEQHIVMLKKSEQLFLKKRMQEHHNFIVKILYYEPVDKNKIIKEETRYYVYTERLYPLCNQLWVPVTSALSILKGFRRLSSSHGMIRIKSDMVRVNSKKQIQVWLNESPVKSQIAYRADDEEQMLADIVKIIMQFDSSTGSLMVNCFTLNEAINNILHSITENKSGLHFSSRTSKKQDKTRMGQKDLGIGINKNNFRSTKQTQDDSLKPFYDNTLKQAPKSQMIWQQKQVSVNYLQGVNVHKSPTYINTNKLRESPKKIQPSDQKKEVNESSINNFNYSHQNPTQKQSTIQFNNTQPHPGKLTGSLRAYKPIQHRNPAYSQSVYSYNSVVSQTNPSNQRPVKQNSNKLQQILIKPYQPSRQSNLSKNYLQKLQTSEEGSFVDNKTGKGSLFVNQRSQINTSREFNLGQNQSFVRNPTNQEPVSLIYSDAGRTKTQQFYSKNELHGVSPRLRTNFITTNAQSPKNIIGQSTINHIKKGYGDSSLQGTSNLNKRMEQNVHSQTNCKPNNEQKYSIRTEPPEDEKKQMKLRQAQRIKQQMGSLGILNNNTKTLTNEKSVRDLLIKQRVQQKNKKHEQLKNAITKLLNQ